MLLNILSSYCFLRHPGKYTVISEQKNSCDVKHFYSAECSTIELISCCIMYDVTCCYICVNERYIFFPILIINEKERSHEPCLLTVLVSVGVKTNSLGDVTRRRYLYRVVALCSYKIITFSRIL